jgi:hypothetical protein
MTMCVFRRAMRVKDGYLSEVEFAMRNMRVEDEKFEVGVQDIMKY